MTPRHFAWQARHILTSTGIWRGSCGTHSHLRSFCVAVVVQMALGGALGLGLGARDAAAFCVAGAAQTHIHLRFAWQAWYRWHWGALGLGLGARDAAAFCVAGAAQSHIYCRFAWQAWHKLTSTVVLRGLYHRFAWPAWYRWHWVARLVLV